MQVVHNWRKYQSFKLNKEVEDVTLVSENLWWLFLTFLINWRKASLRLLRLKSQSMVRTLHGQWPFELRLFWYINYKNTNNSNG